jgi:hypothetical protein
MPEPDEEPSTQDLITLMRAEGDQMSAAAAQFGGALMAFRTKLVEGGVAPEIADQLTCGYWSVLATKMLNA